MRGSRNLTGRSPLTPLGEPDTHSALRGAVPETGIPFQLPNMRSLRTGLLFWRENPPDERYSVSICAQIPTDFRTEHG